MPSPPPPPRAMAPADDLWDGEGPPAAASTERVFQGEPLPARSETMTARSAAVSVVLGATLSIVSMKLGLTAGFLPALTIPAGLLGFFLPRLWIRLLHRLEVPHLPFTRQENTLIQTFVVACSSIAFTGGFGTYILAMSKSSAEGGVGSDGKNVEEPRIARMVAFLFLTSFAGLVAVMPFRDSLIIRHRLTFPSGTAAAHLINTIHTPQGAKQASKQVSMLFKTFGGAIAWSTFQWFFAGGKNCGFQAFPTFGLVAYRRGFYFDFSMANVGLGMICPHKITVSMLLGSLLSWGLIWPYIETKEGQWYPRGLDGDNLSGINGYRVFVGVSMILADGVLHLLSILLRTLYAMHALRRSQAVQLTGGLPFQCLSAASHGRPGQSFDDRRRLQVFLRDRVPSSLAGAGYIVLAGVAAAVIPRLYTQVRCHQVALVYLVAPVLVFCNAYGTGITDANVAATYGKIAMLVFGLWVGVDDGGVVGGLVTCGITMSAISTASDLMQDFKTGYLTLTSPHAMFVSHVAGTALGCVINPAIFWVFYRVQGGGTAAAGEGFLDAPYAKVYRGIAMLGISHRELPRHSMLLCKAFAMTALAVSMVREVAARRRWRLRRYIPSTIGMAIAFIAPPKIPLGMFIGSVLMWLWGRADSGDDDNVRVLSPAVACGLICGDGFGSLLTSMATLFKARPPICIKFVSRQVNKSLDAFLATKVKS